MLRRGVGIGAIKKREQTQSTYAAVGAALESSQLSHLQSSLASFRSNLESFALAHKHAIASQPLFRAQFHAMCLSIGVDPLACQKGFWNSLLGLGDYYYELGVQIMDVCLRLREANGGIMRVEEVKNVLRKRYKEKMEITNDDISQSVSKLACLGSGFQLLIVGDPKDIGNHLLKSVPMEVNVDHITLMNFAAVEDVVQSTSGSSSSSATPTNRSAASASKPRSSEHSVIYPSEVARLLGWSQQRFTACISVLLEEGMVWIDTQGKEVSYCFPALAMVQSM